MRPIAATIRRCISSSTSSSIAHSTSKTLDMRLSTPTRRLISFLSSTPTAPVLCTFLYPRATSSSPRTTTTTIQNSTTPNPNRLNTKRRFSHTSSSPSPSSSSQSDHEGTISAGAADASPSTIPTPPAPEHLDAAERHIYTKLAAELHPTKLEVQDISGGCGSMYGIEIASEAFRGLSMVKQQKLVNAILKEEIGGWHGVQLRCVVP